MSEERRLITTSDIIGQMARWAVVQHPYNAPPRLENVIAVLKKHAEDTFNDGSEIFKYRWFADYRTLLGWVCEASKPAEEILQLWNTPASGHTAAYVFTSRYDKPMPEHDFIDIDALLRNVAREVWNDAKEERS